MTPNHYIQKWSLSPNIDLIKKWLFFEFHGVKKLTSQLTSSTCDVLLMSPLGFQRRYLFQKRCGAKIGHQTFRVPKMEVQKSYIGCMDVRLIFKGKTHPQNSRL